MDSRSHVALSRRLMDAAGAAPELSIAALFPQIDRLPPTLHRLHAHTVFKARAFTELGLALILGEGVLSPPELAFERARFLDERDRLHGYLREQGLATRLEPAAAEASAAVLAYVSHLYLDTFNQPVQPFAPLSIDCCGQWTLWERLGDFRKELYTTDAIDLLRSKIFDHAMWSRLVDHSPEALCEAMLVRMSLLGRHRAFDSSLVDEGMGALRLSRATKSAVRDATEYLAFCEGVLSELHEESLVSRAQPRATGAHVSLAVGAR